MFWFLLCFECTVALNAVWVPAVHDVDQLYGHIYPLTLEPASHPHRTLWVIREHRAEHPRHSSFPNGRYTWQGTHVRATFSAPPAFPSLTVSRSPFSMPLSLFLPCTYVHRHHYSIFHIFESILYFSPSYLHHSIRSTLDSFPSLQTAQFPSFLWPSNVCAYLLSRVQPWLWDTMDCSPPGSSVHGIFQTRRQEWVVISYSRESSQPRNWNCVSCIPCIGRQILCHHATWEAHSWVMFHCI